MVRQKAAQENPPRSDLRAARGSSRAHLSPLRPHRAGRPVQTRAQSIVPAGRRAAALHAPCATPGAPARSSSGGSAPGHPQASAGLGRTRTALLRLLLALAGGGALAGPLLRLLGGRPMRRGGGGFASVGKLQLRERVAQRRKLLGEAAIEHAQQCPRAVNSVAHLLEVDRAGPAALVLAGLPAAGT